MTNARLPQIIPPTAEDFLPLPPLTLVLGGARSGKSTLAEAMIEAHRHHVSPKTTPPDALYIATAMRREDDAEMADRIARHKARRGAGWRTVEEETALAPVVATQPPETPVLIDCLTLWLSNLMLAGLDLAAAQHQLLSRLEKRTAAEGPIVLVSNEVGLGIVPETPLGRAFRDAQGRLNQDMASVAQRVVLVTAGVPLLMKNIQKEF